MNDKKTTRPELVKLGKDWLQYASANNLPKSGKMRNQVAHAFASGHYAAGAIHSGAMFIVTLRGAAELEEWATLEPMTAEELAAKE